MKQIWIAAIALFAPACAETRPTASPTFDDGAGTADGTTSTAASTADDFDSSGSGELKLDLALEPDLPVSECASIAQTTDIEVRPSDILLIADRDVDRYHVQSQVTNLLPGMESEGVFDANVVHVFDGAAPAPVVQGDKSDCGAWACRGAAGYQSVYAEFEAPVAAGDVLSAIIATHDQWAPHMRPHAWKHIWITTSVPADTGMSNDEFLMELRTVLDELGSKGAFFVHVGPDIDSPLTADAAGYTALADQTAGFYELGDFNFMAYQDSVVDTIQGSALACEYEIPPPPAGQLFDRDEVNVLYDDGSGAVPIGRVDAVNECNQFGYGWYYDDPSDPTQIRMCPLSCERFQELANASIEIQFGCATVPAG